MATLTDTDFRFLGQRMGPAGGVNAVLAEVLDAVEADLRDTWQAQGGQGSFESWAGLTEPIVGFRPGAGHHGSGSAVDLNVTQVPYIVTRTGQTYGGEAAAQNQQDMRRRAVEV